MTEEIGTEALQHVDLPGYESNPSIRRLLAQRWKNIPEDKKILIRSARSKRGIKCPICGNIGYYRENCPNGCESPPGTPDSWESTPPQTPPKSPIGLGILWNSSEYCTSYNDDELIKKNKYDYKKKVDINVVRPIAQLEQSHLKTSDAELGSFQFFSLAEDSYASNYSQLTLHQVMRRLMRLLEKQLYKNAEDLEASFDTTLLHPPIDKHDRDTFYPIELMKVNEFRDYYLKKESKNQHKKNYKHQGSLRCIDDLDPLFRGGNVSDDFLYETNPLAGTVSVHSKNTWKSILLTSDTLASSDPIMAKKQQKINELFKKQSKWMSLQKKGMEHSNDRYEHLVYIIQNELKLEHQRENILLQTNVHGKKDIEMKIFQERLGSVDKIMNCLASYNFSSGLEEADFLLFSFERWKQLLESKLSSNHTSSLSSNTTTTNDNHNYCSIKNSNRTSIIKINSDNTYHANSISGNSSKSTLVNTYNNNKDINKDINKDVNNEVDDDDLTTDTTIRNVKQDIKKTTSMLTKASPGGNYNRLISSTNPYIGDQIFLKDLKKKHEIQRIAALRPRDLPKPAIPIILPDEDAIGDIPAHERRKGLYVSRRSSMNSKTDSTNNSFLTTTSNICSSNISNTSTTTIVVPSEVITIPIENNKKNKIKKSKTRESISLDETIAKVLPFQQMSSNETSEDNLTDETNPNPSSNPSHPIMMLMNPSLLTMSNKKNIIHSKRYNNQMVATIPPLNNSDKLSVLSDAKKFTHELLASQEKEDKIKKIMISSKSVKNFRLKPKLHPREIDENKIRKAKLAFRHAGLKDHIRKGQDSDLAYLAPTLIPVPAAFQADGSNPMSSYTAENLMFKVKKNMILADIGYTSQNMVPLYVRNTLLEKNGTTPGGDQTYDTMSTDRRYTHYIGRPLNRFEPDGDKNMSTTMSGLAITNNNNDNNITNSNNNNNNNKSSYHEYNSFNLTTAKPNNNNHTTIKHNNIKNINILNNKLSQEEIAKQRKEYRDIRKIIHLEMEKAKDLPLSHSLVRMAFKDPLPSLSELRYLDEI